MKFQQEVYKAVTADYEQQGLYKQDEINELIYKIKGTNNDLYGKVGQIKGDECLAALIMYLGDEKQRFN